ncbi:MAG: TraR/DksA C4-type zinc finger protein [Pirellulaceae bacterium]|nr:TraR/DksA C4-type zinc finger protein [Planctomycetales bacterium]
MNRQVIERQRAKLLIMRDRVAAEIGSLTQAMLEDAQPVGEHDWGVSEAVDKSIALEHVEEQLHVQISAALARIKDGTYGLCTACGSRIGQARLDALPYAAFCIACERQLESQ